LTGEKPRPLHQRSHSHSPPMRKPQPYWQYTTRVADTKVLPDYRYGWYCCNCNAGLHVFPDTVVCPSCLRKRCDECRVQDLGKSVPMRDLDFDTTLMDL
jgi:hypothetical protein